MNKTKVNVFSKNIFAKSFFKVSCERESICFLFTW